jgi:hypothetical protein
MAIVLNWNGREETLHCLTSLRMQTEPPTIVVVDNGSTDGTPDAVRAAFPETTVIETGANLGYAAGNNVGMRHALASGAEYVFVLNNDVTTEADCVERLVEACAHQADIAAVAPKSLGAAPANRIHFAGGSISGRGETHHIGLGRPDGPAFDAPCDTEWLTGCAVLFPRSALETIGLFDERFFLLFEDADWSLRARRAGLRLRYCPTARVRHIGSVAFGGKASSSYQYYLSRNHLLWLEKHCPAPLRWRLAVHSLANSWRRAARLAESPEDRRRLRYATAIGAGHYFLRRFGAGPFSKAKMNTHVSS